MPEWINTADGATPDMAAMAQQLEMMRESFADIDAAVQRDAALAADSAGWSLLNAGSDEGMSPAARAKAAELADVMAAANPLIKNGLALRVAYVWGPASNGTQVSIQVRDDGAEGQDVNAVVADFLTRNESTFSGSQAHEDMERNGLGIAGEVFLALPTDPGTGTVNARRIQPSEIVDIVTNPDDYADPWLYLRQWTARNVNSDGLPTGPAQTYSAYYPALGWSPAKRPRQINDVPVRWEAPIVHVAVNQPRMSSRGIGDAYPALPWARLSKEFLEQTAMLLSALSRYAWKATTRGDRTQQAARKLATDPGTGGTVVQTAGDSMEAISRSSATIDPKLGQPYQTMVAAALGVPVTMLTGDPGQTGARAVAETLDPANELKFGLRRSLWDSVIRRVCGYVIDQAVIAPGGPLRGTVTRQGSQLIVTLPEDDGRLIDIDWPSWKSTSLADMMDAISTADGIDKLPPMWLARQVLAAFGEQHPDDVLDQLTDDAGNWLPPDVVADQARQRQTDRGERDDYTGTVQDDDTEDTE